MPAEDIPDQHDFGSSPEETLPTGLPPQAEPPVSVQVANVNLDALARYTRANRNIRWPWGKIALASVATFVGLVIIGNSEAGNNHNPASSRTDSGAEQTHPAPAEFTTTTNPQILNGN